MNYEREIKSDDHHDIFHSVIMTEESSWQIGYDAGFSEGEKKGFLEGYNIGLEKGLDIGKEVGFYAGYASHVLKMQEVNSRAIKVCETILQLASTFDDVEPTDQALGEHFAKIQAKFKQLTSLSGVQAEYKTLWSNKFTDSTF
ncbi:protein LTO1 homolog [Physella acuta]|uniref:protein LTO1 homolog n=1 Tax=Physella acuta TaxID=109671 RepID=UPI0027DDA2A1|nr:protein LTO1 homolog [Physella acuta]